MIMCTWLIQATIESKSLIVMETLSKLAGIDKELKPILLENAKIVFSCDTRKEVYV